MKPSTTVRETSRDRRVPIAGFRVAGAILLGLALAMLAVGGPLTAAGPATQATARASTAKVPISFGAPHGYAGVEDYLKKVAAANPIKTAGT